MGIGRGKGEEKEGGAQSQHSCTRTGGTGSEISGTAGRSWSIGCVSSRAQSVHIQCLPALSMEDKTQLRGTQALTTWYAGSTGCGFKQLQVGAGQEVHAAMCLRSWFSRRQHGQSTWGFSAKVFRSIGYLAAPWPFKATCTKHK